MIDPLDHLEFPGPKLVPGLSGGTGPKDRRPPHIWARMDVGPGEHCIRCTLERYGTVEQRLYRCRNGQMRMGAEPGCVRGKGAVTK